jgi:DNA mismatch repair protein MutS2
MNPSVLSALEFDRVREALASRALTALGVARVLALDPSTDPEDVRARLALTGEGVAFVERDGSLAISAPDDLPALIELIGIADRPLEPLALRGLARFLNSCGEVGSAVCRSGSPALVEVGTRVATFTEETAAVERAIDPAGEVTDRASGALRDIREALRRQRAKLRSSLDSLAKGRDTAKYLQERFARAVTSSTRRLAPQASSTSSTPRSTWRGAWTDAHRIWRVTIASSSWARAIRCSSRRCAT